jgi:hypothetical protein
LTVRCTRVGYYFLPRRTQLICRSFLTVVKNMFAQGNAVALLFRRSSG